MPQIQGLLPEFSAGGVSDFLHSGTPERVRLVPKPPAELAKPIERICQ
jgi:hypothetical protein